MGETDSTDTTNKCCRTRVPTLRARLVYNFAQKLINNRVVCTRPTRQTQQVNVVRTRVPTMMTCLVYSFVRKLTKNRVVCERPTQRLQQANVVRTRVPTLRTHLVSNFVRKLRNKSSVQDRLNGYNKLRWLFCTRPTQWIQRNKCCPYKSADLEGTSSPQLRAKVDS